jgi:hypothetical protein
MAPILLGIGAIVHYFSPIKKPEEPIFIVLKEAEENNSFVCHFNSRTHVLDPRPRLLAKIAPSTFNNARGMVEVIFWEEVCRKEINRNSTAGVGMIKKRR